MANISDFHVVVVVVVVAVVVVIVVVIVVIVVIVVDIGIRGSKRKTNRVGRMKLGMFLNLLDRPPFCEFRLYSLAFP